MPTYALGAVKPHVKDAANEIGGRYGIGVVYGFRLGGSGDHPRGLALDFMISTPVTGDNIAQYAQNNAGRLGVTYVIWNRRIWSVARNAEGWRPYSGTTNPHTDHVHISFSPQPGGAFSDVPGVGSTGGIVDVLKALGNPEDIVKRGTWFLSGAVLIFVALFLLGADTLVGQVLKRVGKAGKIVKAAE